MALPNIIPSFTATRSLIDLGSQAMSKSVERLVKEHESLAIVKDEKSAMYIADELNKHTQAKVAWGKSLAKRKLSEPDTSALSDADAEIKKLLNPTDSDKTKESDK